MGVGVGKKPNDALKEYHDRLKVFKRHGYDMMKARTLVINKSSIKSGDVLDVGTGKGHLAIGLAKIGIRFTTIDLDQKTLNIAKHNLKEHDVLSYVCVKRMDAEKLRFKDGAFDHVISVNFIHHAKRPKQCIKEMVRVTRRSITIADLNKRGETVMDKVHKLDGRKHEKSRMSLDGIKKFLEKYGLSVKVYRDTCQTVFIAKREDVMKICIPTETNEGKSAVIYGHFGSAPFFTIVDTEKDSVEIINNVNQHHSHGMCQPMNALMGKKIDAVVSGGMGARAVQRLNEGGIKAYRAVPGTVADIVSQFAKGGLEEITVQNACAQHGCH